MTGNGCAHVKTSNRTEQVWNEKTKQWETWLVMTCDACGEERTRSKQG